MLFTVSTTISADHIRIYDPENYITDYGSFQKYGISGYYNCYLFEGRDAFYFNTESGDCYQYTELGDMNIYQRDGMWYMSSSRIDGVYNGTYYSYEGPLVDVLAGFPQYEYTLDDVHSLQRYLTNPSDESVLQRPIYLKKGSDPTKQVTYTHNPRYYDFDANKKYDVTDLAMMKYDVLHQVTKSRNDAIGY
jgi:hypothetical protein